MGKPKSAHPAKYFTSALSSELGLLDDIQALLELRFGSLEEASPLQEWDYSPAYAQEFGAGIFRRFFVFNRLHDPVELPDWKHAAIELEGEFLSASTPHQSRRINLDPGYLDGSQVILASTKRYGNRVYLRDGIYADLTLHFRHGRYRPLRHLTFRDYRTPEAIEFFMSVRQRYLEQLKQEDVHFAQASNWRQEYRCKTYSSTKNEPTPVLDVLLDYLDHREPFERRNVLDVACGQGRVSISLAARGWNIHGVDFQQDVLEAFRREAEEHNVNHRVHLYYHDVTRELPFHPESFDLVLDIASHTTICLQDSELHSYLDRLARLCAPGGTVLLVTFDEADEYYQLAKENWREGELLRDPNNQLLVRVYNPNALIRAAEETAQLRLVQKSVCETTTVINGRQFRRSYLCMFWEKTKTGV